ncbi:PREDICTED: F-box/WD repeat-containing protein 8-like [Branchiostoma belcheri]|uniref:F-box/WD repeat-containing protein 8-like n=1 Tax=Branchiostoma belcheri TaxID=7741 RepID=A0A6P4ZW47_BRABE|nr:PREDICTED: F-box/WD repeat-containing protein 8-like [Branchiostoma belcheri]
MASNDELKQFVEQWKHEIQSSNHKAAAAKPSGQDQELRLPGTHRFCSSGEGGACSSKQEQQRKESRTSTKTPPHQLPGRHSCNQDDLNSDYRPFVLADQLLKGQPTESLLEERQDRKRRKTDACSGGVSPPASSQPRGNQNTFLEQLISDLDEINEIPFFEISLPRELALQIFQHLSMEDLCRRAQVSSSWRSLADDEVLWQKVGRSLGCVLSPDGTGGQKCKELVKMHVETDRTVTRNWKTRVGQIDYLECAIGGFLSAAYSCGTHIVAGFSEGIVRLWDILADENTPSVLLESNQEQAVCSVSVNPTVTAAAFGSGDVSIWSTEHGGTPLHHFSLDQGGPPQVCTCPGGTVVASARGTVVRVDSPDAVGVWQCRQNFSCDKKVTHLSLAQKGEALSDHLVVMATDYDVYAYRPHLPPEERLRFHALYGAAVECLDATAEQAAVASTCFGVSLEDVFKVQWYSLDTGKQLISLRGHRGQVTCMDLRNSPPNMLVTGAADKRVRVFDVRTPRAVLNQYAHPLGVSCVQMDDWKVVSGGQEGSLCVWDLRSQNKLWEMKPSKVHPIQYCRFRGPHLIAACYPAPSRRLEDPMDQSRRQADVKGRINVYDFSVDQTTRDVPDICKADYDEPEGYNYNINLAMPYDTL